jgi:hypothetical protein
MLDFIGLFIIMAGYVVGLGAVTVIDLHGFLGRKSSYWTEATTRTHKVTKPLIWIGIILVIIGELIFFSYSSFVFLLLMIFNLLLILNGLFLSFSVSSFLLEKEKEGRQKELLPKSWQNKITISFIFSFVGWWGSLAILIFHILNF